MNPFWLGPGIAMAHALVAPGMRALTAAIMFFVLNIIGLGLGPFLTGLVSDLLVPTYGNQALRYSMLTTTQMYWPAMLMYLLAAKHLRADLAKMSVQQRAPAGTGHTEFLSKPPSHDRPE